MNSTIFLIIMLQLVVPMLTAFLERKCNYTHFICNKTQVDDREDERITNIIQKNPALRSFFTKKIVYETLEKDPSRTSRDGEEDTYENLCPTDDVIYVPDEVITVDYQIRRIINLKNYRQVVKVKICRKSSCKNRCTSLAGHGSFIYSKCQQRWSTITLLGTDDKYQNFEYYRVYIPSDCVCTVKNNED